MFREFFANIGTKNYDFHKFNVKMMNCTSGLEVSVDKFCDTEDHEDIHNRKEQLLLSTGFLDRNINEAFDCI